MTIELFNKWGRQSHEIGALEDIVRADMSVYDGAEVLSVTYKTGRRFYGDANLCGHYDGGYPVYDSATGFNLFADSMWLSDGSAYARMI